MSGLDSKAFLDLMRCRMSDVHNLRFFMIEIGRVRRALLIWGPVWTLLVREPPQGIGWLYGLVPVRVCLLLLVVYTFYIGCIPVSQSPWPALGSLF